MQVPVTWCALDTVEYTLADTFLTSPGEGSPLSPRTGCVSLRQDAWPPFCQTATLLCPSCDRSFGSLLCTCNPFGSWFMRKTLPDAAGWALPVLRKQEFVGLGLCPFWLVTLVTPVLSVPSWSLVVVCLSSSVSVLSLSAVSSRAALASGLVWKVFCPPALSSLSSALWSGHFPPSFFYFIST